MSLGAPVETPWGSLVDDDAAIWRATESAVRAYRALTGTVPAREAIDTRLDPIDGVAGRTIAILTGWAGGRRRGVDVARATRLFWLHWLGASLFAESFEELPAPGRTDVAPATPIDAVRGAWETVEAAVGADALVPASVQTLRSPWPADVTVLLLGQLGLLDRVAPHTDGGRVLCPPSPFE